MRLSLALIYVSVVLILLMWAGFLPAPIVLDVHFYLLLFLAIVSYVHSHRFQLYQVWIAGFIFIILSEMLILSNGRTDVQILDYVPSFSFLLLANDVLIVGYWMHKARVKSIKEQYRLCRKGLFLPLIIVGVLMYVVGRLSSALGNLTSGRGVGDAMGSTTLSGVLITALGLILPAIIAYYFRYVRQKGMLWSFILVLPIWGCQFALATRFHLLFSIIPYLILIGLIDLKATSWRKNVLVLFVLVSLAFISSLLKEFRDVSFADWDINSIEKQDERSERFTVKLAQEMSPEGVVAMTKLANDYFSTHSLRYGRETSIILYFWVPRSIWPEKPLQLDYWLIREYAIVSDGFSSASGFTGELRADFGMFSLFFVFVGGMLLRRGDAYVEQVFSFSDNINKILAACLFPYVFFVVRSPLAATQTFIFELVIFFIIKRFMTEKKCNLISRK